MSNTHVEEYLKYYCEMQHAPEYAVLLKAKCGAGKTWFIKKFQENNQECQFLYISLSVFFKVVVTLCLNIKLHLLPLLLVLYLGLGSRAQLPHNFSRL